MATTDWQLSAAAAETYERDFVPVLFARFAPPIVDALDPRPGDRLLDVGCGTGALAGAADHRLGAGCRIVGLDCNDGMLAVAHRLRPHLDWRQGDALDLPFTDGSFDAVGAAFVLMFVADETRAMAEMWRVLAPGGRLAVAVWAPLSECPAFLALTRSLDRRHGAAAAQVLAAPFRLGDADRLQDLAIRAGIEGGRVERVPGTAPYASRREFVRIEVEGTPLAEVVSKAGQEALVQDMAAALPDRYAPFPVPMTAVVLQATKP